MSNSKEITHEKNEFLESISLFYDENENEKSHSELYKSYSEIICSDINYHELDDEKIVYCTFCKSVIKVKFISKKSLNIKCEEKWVLLDCRQALNIYVHRLNDYKEIKYLTCIKHNKPFEKYCKTCKKDLCVDCDIENKCGNDTLQPLSNENVAYVDDYIKKNDNNKENKEDEDYYFILFLKYLLNTHKAYPNNKTLKSLESAYTLLNYLNKGKEKNESIIKTKEGYFIKDKEKLEKKKCKNPLFNIYLNNTNFKNLKYLSKRWLKYDTSLIKLTLAGNNLYSIKFLRYAKLNNLKHLDLSRNKLQDKNIKHLIALNCKKLENLYLYQNQFTDYIIFNEISKNYQLKLFYIGFNRFEKNIDELDDCNFVQLVNIGLNYVFNRDTFHLLQKFKMPNLELFHIQNNEINSLFFLEKMNLTKLKELYLKQNSLREMDINDLLKYKYLEIVNLDCNSMCKINNIENILKMKNLNEFSIEYNKLDKGVKTYIKKKNEKFKIYV